MKKKILFTSLFTSLLVLTCCSGTPKVKANKKLAGQSSAWVQQGKGPSSASSISDTANGAKFSNLNAWGERWESVGEFTLDGLEFDYVWDNTTEDQCVGFYFSNNWQCYMPADHGLNFTLNYPPNWGNQVRLGLSDTNAFASTKYNYLTPSTTGQLGWGLDDGTLVFDGSKPLNMHYAFSKYNSDFYKMSITTSSLAKWKGTNASSNYIGDDTVFTYIPTNKIELDANGATHMFVFGFPGNSGVNPTVEVNNVIYGAKHTVTFVSNGGTSIPSQEIRDGNTVTKPTDPVKEGFTFGGWFTDDKFTNAYNFASAVKSDLTLYAKWTQTHTFTYDADEISVISYVAGMTPDGYQTNAEVLSSTDEVTGYQGKVLKLSKTDGNVNGPGIVLDFTDKYISTKEILEIKFRYFVKDGNESRITVDKGSNWVMRHSLTGETNTWSEVSLKKDGTNFMSGASFDSLGNSSSMLSKFFFCFRASSVAYIDSISIIVGDRIEYNPPVFGEDVPNNLSLPAGNVPSITYYATDDTDGIIRAKNSWSNGAFDHNGKLVSGSHTLTLIAVDSSGNVAKKNIAVTATNLNLNLSHSINVDKESGCVVTTDKKFAKSGEEISLTISKISSTANLSISVKTSAGNPISISGSNPYTFIMPDCNVYIEATNNENEGYMNPSNFDIFDENYISYEGRHYKQGSGMYFTMSASGFLLEINVTSSTNSIVANFTGSVSVGSGETSQYGQTFIDISRFGNRVVIPSGTNNVTIVSNIPTGKHTIRFLKCNESNSSSLRLNSLSFSDGISVKNHVETRPIIEFYGDSITCGYGNLAKSSSEGFRLDTEDATNSYAFLTGEKLGYRAQLISFSGIGIACSQGGIDSYVMKDKFKTYDGDKLFNLRNDNRKIIVINLGTNDYAMYNFTYGSDATNRAKILERMVPNVRQLIGSLYNANPTAKFVYCYDMMVPLHVDILNKINEGLTQCEKDYNIKIHRLQFTCDSSGADGHPGATAHAHNATTLANYITNNVL